MKSFVVFLFCTSIIGAGAYRGGRFDDARSVKSELMRHACERLSSLPMTVGDWAGAKRPVSDEESMRRGGAVRFESRIYKLTESNESAVVLLLCGKPGPLSVHTPEICIAGANYAADSNQTGWSPTSDSNFTWRTFTSKVDGQPNLEIAWAWTVGGDWKSPRMPRLTFGKEPFLYKLYVIRPCLREAKPSPPMEHLLSTLVPALQKTVFDGEKAAASVESATSKAAANLPESVR